MQLLGSKGCVKRKNRFYSAKERAKNAPLLRLKGKDLFIFVPTSKKLQRWDKLPRRKGTQFL